MKFEFVCMADGPTVSMGELTHDASCTQQRGHNHEHRWFSDDGSVLIRWDDDWSLDDANWRNLTVILDSLTEIQYGIMTDLNRSEI